MAANVPAADGSRRWNDIAKEKNSLMTPKRSGKQVRWVVFRMRPSLVADAAALRSAVTGGTTISSRC